MSLVCIVLLFQSVSPDDNTLIGAETLHAGVGVVSNGEDMGRHLTDLTVAVVLDVLRCVEG